MIAGLVVALVSAALINIGFLLQHRGLGRSRGATTAAQLWGALRQPAWLAGQAVGWVGFGAQIVAVAIAPLALVQAFAAGGLALSVPLAAVIFRHRITRTQAVAVVVMAVGLAALPIGFSTTRDHLHGEVLTAAAVAGALAALAIARPPAPWCRAIAAGIFYGIADAAIKALSLGIHHGGAGALVSGWTAVAGLGTFAGFLAFQSGLRGQSPVAAISLMNALAALAALGCGLVAFGESLGIDAGADLAHLAAIVVVLAAVPVLAAAQATIAESPDARHPTPRRAGTLTIGERAR